MKGDYVMDLSNIMTTNVISVWRNTSLQEAASLMKEHNIGSIPVCDGGRVVGIVTDRDIVLRGVADGAQTSRTTCGEVMSKEVVTGTVSMDVHEAARIMADNQIRRLPIVDNGRLVGVVALGDLAVESKLVNEAGDALNDISKPSKPML